jgi:hypothetical protein
MLPSVGDFAVAATGLRGGAQNDPVLRLIDREHEVIKKISASK